MCTQQSPSHADSTHWSVVLRAANDALPGSREALEQLCAKYHRPIFAIARSMGHNFHDAEDLTQGFFEYFIESGLVRSADPERGRFRNFLHRTFQRYSQKVWAKNQALKRGGGTLRFSMDGLADFDLELSSSQDSGTNPATVFDKRWAMVLFNQSFLRLQEHYDSTGRGEVYRSLKPFVDKPGNVEAYTRVATTLGVEPGAIATRVSRMRDQLFEFLRLEVEQTVERPDMVQEELSYILKLLTSS